MKICIKCELEKSIDSFYKGNCNVCKECKREYQIKYREFNKDAIQKYREENKDIISEKNIEYQRRRREDNVDEVREYRKKYRISNIEKSLMLEKESRKRNKERIKISDKKYRKNNKELLYSNIRKRMDSDPLFKSKVRIRILISNSIHNMGYTKRSKTNEILGCSFDEFKKYIEDQFFDGMSWDNHGEWHMDHKIPASWAKTEEELLKLNHYTNFQPLWSVDNLSKGNKFCS